MKEAARRLFSTGGPQMGFVDDMVAFTNMENVRRVYTGFQSYPVTEDNQTLIQISYPSGQIQTPGFDSKSQPVSRKITSVLKFPNLKLVPTNQSLALRILADPDQGEQLMISGGNLEQILG